MNIPYVGITGFANFGEVNAMLKVFNEHKSRHSVRKLHVGVMMSYKTLNDIPSRWQKVFPLKEKIAEIFSSEEVYNCLHYADYEGQSDFANNLAKAIFYGGIGIRAVQLDMIWPQPSEIMHGVHSSRKKIEVILQVGSKALEEVSDDPDELVERLHDYRSVINRVLLDKSLGRGLEMDADVLLPFARAIKTSFPEIELVVAGGLGPDTIHLAEPLVEEFPYVSLDAQGQLCPNADCKNPINWDLAGTYLIRALELVD